MCVCVCMYVLQRDNPLARDTGEICCTTLFPLCIYKVDPTVYNFYPRKRYRKVCVYVCTSVKNHRRTVLIKCVARGKLNLTTCHNVRGRKGFFFAFSPRTRFSLLRGKLQGAFPLFDLSFDTSSQANSFAELSHLAVSRSS